MTLRFVAALFLWVIPAVAQPPQHEFPASDWPGCEPESDFQVFRFEDPIKKEERQVNLDFCFKWNPDFSFNKRRCCAVFRPGRRNRNQNKCPPSRYKTSYCNEMTTEQVKYAADVKSGRIKDILEHIKREIGRRGEQAYCTVNNGFLAHGRQIIPTDGNRLELRSPSRCLNFGTDGMAGMLEWVGRQVAQKYSDADFKRTHVLIGDVAAPRGGCLWGRSGRRGHASHTSGLDADVGFLTPTKGKASPLMFHKQLDAKVNWWFLQQIFKNPFA